jgi:hypothetical protein
MSEGDEEMPDAARAPGDKISKKIKSLLNVDYEIDGSFQILPVETGELQSLRDAQAQSVIVPHSVGSAVPTVSRYNVKLGKKGAFLDLSCEPSLFYARSGYQELYHCISQAWKSNKYRAALIGNAGTGKSWFQIYALKQLMDDNERKYDVVIRQVGSKFYVIDLSAAEVHLWKTTRENIEVLSKMLQKTLYFFEPGGDKFSPPLEVFIPSLATLSPFEGRIAEYSKRFMTPLYFWPWAVGEMWAIVCDAKLALDFDIFFERYKKFGGILRNVLGEDVRAGEKLIARLENISLDILTSIALDVDREETGNNVSGYLVCYDNRFVEGATRFSTKNLEYTSVLVEEEVAKRLHTKPTKEKMCNVLKRIDGEMLDLSGKNLEDVAMELLSEGTAFSWLSCEVGTANPSWRPFSMRKRIIRRIFSIENNFTQSNLILAPTNMRFPVIDFLCSLLDSKLPVLSFQCTWQDRHPFTVRALYDLRCQHLKIGDDKKLEIYLVTPGKESTYVLKQKDDFLDGSVDVDLRFSKTVTVPAAQLRAMWDNTTIFVVSPSQSWKNSIEKWLATQQK